MRIIANGSVCHGYSSAPNTDGFVLTLCSRPTCLIRPRATSSPLTLFCGNTNECISLQPSVGHR
jgi:hypothetical protein